MRHLHGWPNTRELPVLLGPNHYLNEQHAEKKLRMSYDILKDAFKRKEKSKLFFYPFLFHSMLFKWFLKQQGGIPVGCQMTSLTTPLTSVYGYQNIPNTENMGH